jgi:hypothetical protein
MILYWQFPYLINFQLFLKMRVTTMEIARDHGNGGCNFRARYLLSRPGLTG